jgi:Lrp/AsnC family leucine-responsive transcriptional regulator
MEKPLGPTDRKILAILQTQGRITNAELAKQINLSPTPCLERTRRLERDGYILGYSARLDPGKVGAALLIFVQVTLDRTTPDVFAQFKAAVVGLPEVIECHMVAGGFDYLMKVRTRDMAGFRQLLGAEIASLPGVLQTHTYVVMEEIKTGHTLPLSD